jgi:hypothetical protein
LNSNNAFEEPICIVDQNDSIIALSNGVAAIVIAFGSERFGAPTPTRGRRCRLS